MAVIETRRLPLLGRFGIGVFDVRVVPPIEEYNPDETASRVELSMEIEGNGECHGKMAVVSKIKGVDFVGKAVFGNDTYRIIEVLSGDQIKEDRELKGKLRWVPDQGDVRLQKPLLNSLLRFILR